MNIVEQVKSKLKQEIKAAVIKANLATEDQIPDVILEMPKDKVNGDYSTNMAMQLTRVAKKAPKMIAEELVAHFDNTKASIEKIEIAALTFGSRTAACAKTSKLARYEPYGWCTTMSPRRISSKMRDSFVCAAARRAG